MSETPVRLSFGGRIRRFMTILGPGMIMMATVVGASHVILSPVAGARFGYSLLWLVLFSHTCSSIRHSNSARASRSRAASR